MICHCFQQRRKATLQLLIAVCLIQYQKMLKDNVQSVNHFPKAAGTWVGTKVSVKTPQC